MIIMNRVLNVTVIFEKQSRSSVVDNFRLDSDFRLFSQGPSQAKIEHKHTYNSLILTLVRVGLDLVHPIIIPSKGLVINYGEGGYKTGRSRDRNFFHPPAP